LAPRLAALNKLPHQGIIKEKIVTVDNRFTAVNTLVLLCQLPRRIFAVFVRIGSQNSPLPEPERFVLDTQLSCWLIEGVNVSTFLENYTAHGLLSLSQQ